MGFYQSFGMRHYRFNLSDFKQVTDLRSGSKRWDFLDSRFSYLLDVLICRCKFTEEDLKGAELWIDDSLIQIRLSSGRMEGIYMN